MKNLVLGIEVELPNFDGSIPIVAEIEDDNSFFKKPMSTVSAQVEVVFIATKWSKNTG